MGLATLELEAPIETYHLQDEEDSASSQVKQRIESISEKVAGWAPWQEIEAPGTEPFATEKATRALWEAQREACLNELAMQYAWILYHKGHKGNAVIADKNSVLHELGTCDAEALARAESYIAMQINS